MGEGREFLDASYEDNQPWSDDQVRAATKYLHWYQRRTFVESESGSKIDALPERIVEHFCARKLVNVMGLEDVDRKALPAIASLVAGDTSVER